MDTPVDENLARYVAQDAFVEAVVRIRQLRDDRSFTAWLRTIVVRMARRRRPRASTPTCLPYGESKDARTPEAKLMADELRQAVDGALASLKPIYREALALAIDGELSSMEAAKVLGCSPQAYRVRVCQARRELRKRLSDFLED